MLLGEYLIKTYRVNIFNFKARYDFMFRLMISCFLCLTIVILTGCKTEAEIPVRLNDLNAKSTHIALQNVKF